MIRSIRYVEIHQPLVLLSTSSCMYVCMYARVKVCVCDV
jgi:hypothetical protein